MSESKKRKAITHDSPEADEVALSDGTASDTEDNIFDNFLNEETGAGSGLEDGSNDDDLDIEEEALDYDSEDIDLDEQSVSDGFGSTIASDEIPSENGEQRSIIDRKFDNDVVLGEIEDGNGALREFTVTENADGESRYVYDDINPVYDSDDSEALKPRTPSEIYPFHTTTPILTSAMTSMARRSLDPHKARRLTRFLTVSRCRKGGQVSQTQRQESLSSSVKRNSAY